MSQTFIPSSVSSSSKTLTSIDLRLTRPPDSLKPILSSSMNILPSTTSLSPDKLERPRTNDGYNDHLHNNNSNNNNNNNDKQIVNKRKKPKIQTIKKDQSNMFEDLSPEAQRRLNAMLRNFCLEENGGMKTNIDLEQYSIDAGEVITNATIQELCIVQPNLLTLNLKGCDLISDVALWTIARHCPNIKHLILSGCNKITNIGLRSLSMRCSELITLDFTDCHLLDDIGLSTIACGCWKLENLILINCINITDTGIGKVVKACGRLQVLNLFGCSRVGEFGDHALKEIGAFCNSLKYLNLIGCRHVHNDGLIALSQGCQHLETLCLSHCDGINGYGLMALCKYLSHLKTLILRDCEHLNDEDMNIFKYASFSKTLTSIDISDCKSISNLGISTLCNHLGLTLKSINLAGCKITDNVIPSICNSCEKLNELDLSRCKLLTDNTIHSLVIGVTGLTTLKLDGNQKITSKALLSYITGIKKLEFANVSQQWFGYEPKKDADKLIIAKELLRIQTRAVIIIQCMIRCHQAYKRYLDKRRIWLVNKFIPRVQALFRGRRERKKYQKYQYQLLRNHMALKIQRSWRRYLEVLKRYLHQRRVRIAQMKLSSARLIQRIYWGMVGKRKAKDRRNELANIRLQEARLQALKESKAIRIQCLWHMYCAKQKMKQLKIKLRERKIYEAIRDRMARIIQRLERGRKGRKKARYARWLAAKKALMWNRSRDIQRVYRGHVGRLKAKAAREERWRRICWQKAIVIQCFWRTMRAKMIVAVLRALEILRAKQFHNAREIQRVYRGMRVRMRMEQLRAELMEQLKRVLAAIKIQKIFRGHKGREIAEVERALKLSEEKAKPLYSLLRDLEEEGIKLTKYSSKLEGMIAHTEKEITEISRELDHATKTTSKFTDSSRVNGIPQRFLTKYLVVRLNDNLTNERELLKKHIAAHIETKSNLRAVDRKIRAAKRELIPLTTGLIIRVKNERFQRLRNRVRLVRKSAIKIQSLWRRAIVRKTYRDPNRDYWVECYDDEQGPEPYYYNTWTLETVWKAPLAYRLFVSKYKKNSIDNEFIYSQYNQDHGNGNNNSNEKDVNWVEIEQDGIMYDYNVVTKEYRRKN